MAMRWLMRPLLHPAPPRVDVASRAPGLRIQPGQHIRLPEHAPQRASDQAGPSDGGSDMGAALADAAQSAVGLALVNPLAIAAVILLLYSPRAGSAAAFLAGWLAGLVVILGLL